MLDEENTLVARVGKGTPMGELMRRCCLPALVSSELEADGDPLRIMLLGEKLLAFRDSNRRIGVMDHVCPHRCAALFYGRNEEGGIRCVYHGCKFDADGNCLEMGVIPGAASRPVRRAAARRRARSGSPRSRAVRAAGRAGA